MKDYASVVVIEIYAITVACKNPDIGIIGLTSVCPL